MYTAHCILHTIHVKVHCNTVLCSLYSVQCTHQNIQSSTNRTEYTTAHYIILKNGILKLNAQRSILPSWTSVFPGTQNIQYLLQAGVKYEIYQAQFYGRSRQCGRLVKSQCSMGLGHNPLINGLIAFQMIFTALTPRLIQSTSRNVHNKIRALKRLCRECTVKY